LTGFLAGEAEFKHVGIVVARLPELDYCWRGYEEQYKAEIGLWHNIELIAPDADSPLRVGQVHTCYEVIDLAHESALLRTQGWIPVAPVTQTLLFHTQPVQFFYRAPDQLLELVEWQE
jgi:hypothetical protein